MALIAVGANHRTAPIEVRERFAFAHSEISAALATFREACGVREAVLLSTCNRTEFYFVEGDRAEDRGGGATHVARILGERLGADATPHLYVCSDREAAGHLFRVASGLDSMIVGEAQIQGQVRDAWERSREHAGAVLNRLFQTALLTGSRVRTETAVGRGAA